ncbi:hypothetical protein Dimus_004978 [Dionaea muscipula]
MATTGSAVPSRSSVFSLLRSLLRAARTFSDYNIREYAKRRTLDGFRHNRAVSDPATLSKLFSDGKFQLEVAKRQATVYSLFQPKVKSIMEVKQ